MNYYKPGNPCPGNSAVICPDHNKCNRCGWNPDVAEKRLAAVIEENNRRAEDVKHN